ncbi:MAG: helix-turn-helix transcriptional regulator [Alphaproteobacteria bacterium]
MDTIAERVHELRTAMGLSQAGLAKRIGVSPQSIQQLESGLVTHPRYLDELARALHTTREWLLYGERPKKLEPAAGPHQPRPRDLPVLGGAVGGDDGEFSLNGDIVEYVTRPQPLETVDNAYALYVIGSSMEPRYFAGELLYVNPNRPVGPGSFVVIELRDGRAMIKRLVRQDNRRVVLEQYNPSTTFEIARDDIARLHLVVQSGMN